jgi:hypothetical protein
VFENFFQHLSIVVYSSVPRDPAVSIRARRTSGDVRGGCLEIASTDFLFFREHSFGLRRVFPAELFFALAAPTFPPGFAAFPASPR